MATTKFTGNPVNASGAYAVLEAITGTGTPEALYDLDHDDGIYALATTGLSGTFLVRLYNGSDQIFGIWEADIGNKTWGYDPGQAAAEVNVNILPNVVRQAELQQGSKIKAWVRQGSPIFGSVYDSANNPVNLNSYAGIKCTITTANGVELLVVPDGDIEITGTGNNTFYFDPPAELVERARVLQWSLRDTSDEELISSGTLEIIFAP